MPVDKKPENFIETIKDIFRRLSLLEINSSSGGTGAVDSVNGLTGVVVLNQDNILDGTTNKQYSITEKNKLAGIESGADITDTANVTSAGALMDSEVDPDIKTLVLPAGTTISSFGASLISETTSSDARITLDVDQAGTDNSTNVSLAGVYNYLTIVGQVITLGLINLTTDVTGLLPTANVANLSGTNTGDQILPVKATGAELDTGTDDAKFATAKAIKDSKNVPSVAPGTTGNVLTSDGVDWQSTAPTGGTGGVSVLEVQVFS